MKVVWLLLLVVIWNDKKCLAQLNINNKKFPDDFSFGVASASYQIEGGWNEGGKGEGIWDYIVHTNSSLIVDGSNGDISCNSYHKYKEDVQHLKELGVNHYRFSISWSRLLPTGFNDNINVEAIDYYLDLIHHLKINNIVPVVTLFHWDIPRKIQEMGGFINPSMEDWFANYAKVAYKFFGKDVKYWITINEPNEICTQGYGYGTFPPYIKSEAILEYQCMRILLKAHAKAWHVYNDEFKPSQKGGVSITLDALSYLPASGKKADQQASERALEFMLGIYANPIYLGDFPEIVKTRVAMRSKAEGRNQSRLPEFTDKEIAYIKGTHDFFGVNVYSGALVADLGYEPPIVDPPTKFGDAAVNVFQPEEWENTTLPFVKIVPWTVKHLLNWIKDKYNNPGILITENGYPDSGNKNDDRRIYVIKEYLSAIRDVMIDDDVKMVGYTVWSLMDDFEWSYGYTLKYGLHEVDFNSPDRKRTARQSAYFYKKVIKNRCLVDHCVD